MYDSLQIHLHTHTSITATAKLMEHKSAYLPFGVPPLVLSKTVLALVGGVLAG